MLTLSKVCLVSSEQETLQKDLKQDVFLIYSGILSYIFLVILFFVILVFWSI